jgi:transcriptional regulator with XRE-family HTH domain
MTSRKVFGPAIKYIRKAKGITQDELAVYLEISPSHLHRVETGERTIGAALIPLIARRLKVDETEFTYEVDTHALVAA